MIENGTYTAVVMTELVREGGDLVSMIKYLLQSGIAPGTTSSLAAPRIISITLSAMATCTHRELAAQLIEH